MKITSGLFIKIKGLATTAPALSSLSMSNTVRTYNWQRFHFTSGSSNKFWEIRVNGTCHEVRFGRIGTVGQVRSKDHGSEERARAEVVKLINSKIVKGYVRQGETPAETNTEVVEAPTTRSSRWTVIRTVSSVRQRPVPIFNCKVISSSNRSDVNSLREIEFSKDVDFTVLRKCSGCNELYPLDDNKCEACLDSISEELLSLTRDELIERVASKSIPMSESQLVGSLLDINALSQSNWHAMPYDVDDSEDLSPIENEPEIIEAKVVVEEKLVKSKKVKKDESPKEKKEYTLVTKLVNGEQTCDIYIRGAQYKIVMNGDKVFTKSFSKESVARGAISMLIASRKAVGYVEQQEDIED